MTIKPKPPRLDETELRTAMSELKVSRWPITQMRARDDWYRIEARAGSNTAEIWIFDEIGWFGVSAQDFARELQNVNAKKITLHLNTPGGDVFDGIAIYNSLRDHEAEVTVIVEALAASAGSFIAQAGDRIVMNHGSQMMIHDPRGVAIGNAQVMRKTADMLSKLGDSMAGIYTARAGGTVSDWREAMRAETWYTAEEAVEAGLADETADASDEEAQKAVASWDLTIYAHAGRQAAPNPFDRRTPSAQAAAPAADDSTLEVSTMDPAKIREALGLAADVSDDEVKTAAIAAFDIEPPAPPTPPAQPAAPAPAQQAPPPPPAQLAPAPAPAGQPNGLPVAATQDGSGIIPIDSTVLDGLIQQAKKGELAFARMQQQERDEILDAAIRAGKFPPARRDHYVALWESDPDGARATIQALRPGLVPVEAAGYLGADAEYETDQVYSALYGQEG